MLPVGSRILITRLRQCSITFIVFYHQEEEIELDFVNIVFIGHVDAGKSTMSGQILKLTGMVDQRTLEKYERESKEKNRESWALSWY